MKYARIHLSFVAYFMIGAILGFSTGCDDRATKLAAEKYYRQQEKILERQHAEWERQLASGDAQDERYEAILAKWEEHIERVESLLDRWDRIMVNLEDRSGGR